MKICSQDDTELLDRVKDDDRSAFEMIYRKYWKHLYDFAFLKTHDTDVSEDIVQDLFVTVWEKRKTLKVKNLRAYLFTAIRNSVIDHYKEKIFSEIDHIEPVAEPEYALFLEEFETFTQNSIAQLPDKTKRIFLLSRFEGKTVREISTDLNLPERTVEYHITQALRTLRFLLREFITISLLICINIIF